MGIEAVQKKIGVILSGGVHRTSLFLDKKRHRLRNAFGEYR